MADKNISLLKMIRAPFLSSVYAPIFAGTSAAVLITGNFDFFSFIIVLIFGTGLHAATNVYNDIYDTIQGTDKINIHRNEFSGGSGVLVDNPELFPKMYWIARGSLIIAFLSLLILLTRIDASLYYYLISLFLLSAFFSKYYTAAPLKLSYRGLGEISVWFAFGPMGVLVGAVSQNIGLHEGIIAIMPATGLSTLSILWLGQLIDLPADQATGKLGLVARLGSSKSKKIFPFIHLMILLNIILIPFIFHESNFLVYLPLIPYLLLLPKIIRIVLKKEDGMENLKAAAKLNVMLHILFSATYSLGIIIQLI